MNRLSSQIDLYFWANLDLWRFDEVVEVPNARAYLEIAKV